MSLRVVRAMKEMTTAIAEGEMKAVYDVVYCDNRRSLGIFDRFFYWEKEGYRPAFMCLEYQKESSWGKVTKGKKVKRYKFEAMTVRDFMAELHIVQNVDRWQAFINDVKSGVLEKHGKKETLREVLWLIRDHEIHADAERLWIDNVPPRGGEKTIVRNSTLITDVETIRATALRIATSMAQYGT